MKIKTLVTALMLGGAVFSSAVFAADDASAAPAKGKRPNMRRGGNRFSPAMMFTMLVGKELKAYNENKTEENYKKLEEAVKNAANKMTEEFLQKAKAGELKMPARPQRGRGGKGKGKGAKRHAPAQD